MNENLNINMNKEKQTKKIWQLLTINFFWQAINKSYLIHRAANNNTITILASLIYLLSAKSTRTHYYSTQTSFQHITRPPHPFDLLLELRIPSTLLLEPYIPLTLLLDPCIPLTLLLDPHIPSILLLDSCIPST